LTARLEAVDLNDPLLIDVEALAQDVGPLLEASGISGASAFRRPLGPGAAGNA